jgi:hypothetical protein
MVACVVAWEAGEARIMRAHRNVGLRLAHVLDPSLAWQPRRAPAVEQ